MTTVTSNIVTVDVTTPAVNYCTTGQYITIYGSSTTAGTGYAYPYSFASSLQLGYSEVSVPNFCVYYEGGKAPTGCYCNFIPDQLRGAYTHFYTNNKGGWMAEITIYSNSFSFLIQWSE